MEKIKLPVSDNDSFEKYAVKETDKIREDIEFYELVKKMGPNNEPISRKVVQDNLSKIITWHEDFLYCKNCPGIDKCAKETPHLKMDLKYDGVFVKRYFDPCDKFLQSIDKTIKYVYADFPEEWEDISSVTNDVDLDELRMNAITRLAEIASKGDTDKSIYLYGKSGVGKSYLAVSLANDYYLNPKNKGQIAYISTLNRFKELQDNSYYNKDAFSHEMSVLINVGVLVLDGFGNEFKSDYVRDMILIPLLSERRKRKLLTIFTSNFTIGEIVEMYSLSRAGSIRARQLGDILFSVCDKEIELVSHLY